jgi:hypothetical protein
MLARADRLPEAARPWSTVLTQHRLDPRQKAEDLPRVSGHHVFHRGCIERALSTSTACRREDNGASWSSLCWSAAFIIY